MNQISVSSLREGQRLQECLYNHRGIKLLPCGTHLTETIIERLRAFGPQFYLTRAVPELVQAGLIQAMDPRRFKAGSIPPRRVLTAGGRPLSQVADRLEQHHLDALEHGVYTLSVPEPRAEARARDELDREILAQKQPHWADLARTIPGKSVDGIQHATDNTTRQADGPRFNAWPSAGDLAQWRDTLAERIGAQYARMLAWLPIEVSVLNDVVDDLLVLFRTDQTRFTQIALMCPRTSDYVPHHAIGAAVLSISMAYRKSWPWEDIRLAGMSALVHDAGMLMLPQRIRTQPGSLCDVDRTRVLAHPVDSALMLLNSQEIPEAVAMAAYRHHERDNGHGYPLGLLGSRIGKLPRLLAVADSASALNEPRPYRADVLPHTAVMQIAEAAGEGYLFRPMVRALVESIGLYPIGSYVLLSDERVARVIGIRHDSVDQPIVEICTETGLPSGEVIDLTRVEPWELSALDGCSDPTLTQAA